MAKKDPRVEAAVAKAAPFAQPILRRVRQLIHQAVPEIEEDLKWRMPAFTYRGDIFAILAPFKKHCIFILWRHKLLKKQLNPAEQKLLKNFRRLTSAAELPKATILLKLLKATRLLHATGAKPTQPKARAKSRPLTVPHFFKKALATNARARTTFTAFSYSKKKDYVDWLTEAKTPATRQRRLKTALLWINEGKARHWQYAKQR